MDIKTLKKLMKDLHYYKNIENDETKAEETLEKIQ